MERLFARTWSGRRGAGGLGFSLYEQCANRSHLICLFCKRLWQMMYIDLIIAGIYRDLSNARGIKVGSTHIKALLIDEWTKRLYSEVSEKSPLHGTKPENVESVYTQGLDPRLARKRSSGPRYIWLKVPEKPTNTQVGLYLRYPNRQ
ncbi:hypothetical protein DPMN_047145 [Dreissena polymorpha]|uniref:Uncharacterized protein n=1 Tax=Dreissena polymorpha TaxID=45954 RepID=A0A9D4I165_DREPO|nr:hypothetical protein DPMN_047145 [Dreissena polymorpha]